MVWFQSALHRCHEFTSYIIPAVQQLAVWILGHRGDSWDMKYFLSKYLFPLCKIPKHYIERKFDRFGHRGGSWDMKYFLYLHEYWPACQIMQSTTMYSLLSSATMLLYLAVQSNVPAMELTSRHNHRHWVGVLHWNGDWSLQVVTTIVIGLESSIKVMMFDSSLSGCAIKCACNGAIKSLQPASSLLAHLSWWVESFTQGVATFPARPFQGALRFDPVAEAFPHLPELGAASPFCHRLDSSGISPQGLFPLEGCFLLMSWMPRCCWHSFVQESLEPPSCVTLRA